MPVGAATEVPIITLPHTAFGQCSLLHYLAVAHISLEVEIGCNHRQYRSESNNAWVLS